MPTYLGRVVYCEVQRLCPLDADSASRSSGKGGTGEKKQLQQFLHFRL